jgi:histone acetyltransferase (RNA polymerase elongator complex component)
MINSTNKMKTIRNIIKSETNRLKGHTVSNYENSPDTFNDHFLSVAEKIMPSIRRSDTEDTSDNENPIRKGMMELLKKMLKSVLLT